jgi:hypothetical protein
MANPNPSPLTRFKKGKSGHEGHFGPHRATIVRSLPQVRSLADVLADPDSWKGTMQGFCESVARDPNNPLDIRLAVAERLRQGETALVDAGEPQMTSKLVRASPSCWKKLAT